MSQENNNPEIQDALSYIAGVDPARTDAPTRFESAAAAILRLANIGQEPVAEYQSRPETRGVSRPITLQELEQEIYDEEDVEAEEEDEEIDLDDDVNYIPDDLPAPAPIAPVIPPVNVPAKYSRFKDAAWFGGKEDVLVGGAGGIGSWLCMLLTRAGFPVTVYDFDKLEEHNLSGQLFKTTAIGQSKTFALSNIINDLCGSPINNLDEKYDEFSMINNYTFAAFDNMLARKVMFKKWLENYANDANAIFIDGRLLFEQMTIFCIRGNDAIAINRYQDEELFSDKDVADEQCTLKQTTHTAAMIAAHMVGFFTNFLTAIKSGTEPMNLPYRFEYLIPLGIVPND